MSDGPYPQGLQYHSQRPAKRQQPVQSKDQDRVLVKRTRGRSGCLNCRRRRKKCDETKPVCSKCASRGESCKWDEGFSFRLSGIDAQHPSMVQSRLSKPEHANTYQIKNVSFGSRSSPSEMTDLVQHAATIPRPSPISDQEFPRKPNETQATSRISEKSPSDRPILNQALTEENLISKQQTTNWSSQHHHRPIVSSESRGMDPKFYNLNSNDSVKNKAEAAGTCGRSASGTTVMSTSLDLMELESDVGLTPGTRNSDEPTDHQSGHTQFDITSMELEALDYLTCQSSNIPLFAPDAGTPGTTMWNLVDDPNLWSSPIAEPPDATTPYPNASYKSLHSILCHHMVETARNTASTRHGSPDQLSQDRTAKSYNAAQLSRFDSRQKQTQEPTLNTTSSNFTKIPQRRRIELWQNYLDEIAVWLDMFDNDRQFQLQIPQLAKSAGHLQCSVLALSARQIERKNPASPYTESLSLYQEAIKLILQELHTLDTAVIASCVLLCVLEMMSSAPRAWSRHLDGCAMLLEAAGVNGVVGGVRQSLFWCFARMDVWGGYLGDTLTKIPTNRWFFPSKSMVDAITHFKEGSGCDSYANYSVFLCASVVNVVTHRRGSPVGGYGVESASNSTFSLRWKALFDLLDDWYKRRPIDMQPILSFSSVLGEHDHPFPSVLYSNSPAINGNQLYHAATLLMLQEKPKDVQIPKNAKSILWHARQICGIAASNAGHGPWINALQPLWIAGKIMSHATEHNAILKILANIERETGWATAWRAQDLKDYWGDAHS